MMGKYLLTWNDHRDFHALEFTDVYEARKYVIWLEDDCKDIKIWQLIDEYMSEDEITP